MYVPGDTLLEEYKVVTTGTKTECWIESKEGLQFTVNMFLTPRGEFLESSEVFLFKVYVDGQIVGDPGLGHYDDDFHSSYILRGVYVSETLLKPFKFAKTHFTGTTLRLRDGF
jgi:hypothetical protein